MTAEWLAGLAGLRQAEQDATETPWRHDWQNDHRLPHGGTYVVRDQVGAELADTGPYKRGWNDALLIALLRNNAAALIAAAEAVEKITALCEQARKVSPSPAMNLYLGDVEQALGLRTESTRGIVGQTEATP